MSVFYLKKKKTAFLYISSNKTFHFNQSSDTVSNFDFI